MISALSLGRSVHVPDVAETLPLKLPQGIVPLGAILVTAPVEVLRVAVTLIGLSVVDLARHSTPKVGSLILKDAPISNTMRFWIIGRLPMNPSYVRCQGIVSARAVAVPLEHLSTVT
jgi:hypothetical protein